MSLKSKRECLEKVRVRYRRASRLNKINILTAFCEDCSYERKYASKLLAGKRGIRTGKKSGRERIYRPEVLLKPLKAVWLASHQPCSKRLVAALPLWLRYTPDISPAVAAQLMALSASSIDRMLRSVRISMGPKGRCSTKPGTLLKKQIPIRTEHWDVKESGYIEADTVAHCGDRIEGEYVWTVTLTDIHTGWTTLRAVWGKGASGVLAQIRDVEATLPFAIRGFDCDNGSEFLNHHLVKYFIKRKSPVGFTRSRPYRKNDNAHVEQKNWTHVRELLGYERFDRPEVVPLLNALYKECWEPLSNFYHPVTKLTSKVRLGAKYIKKYDKPLTPAERLSREITISNKCQTLLLQGKARNPYELKRELERRIKGIFNVLRCPPM